VYESIFLDKDVCINYLNVSLFDENIIFYFTFEIFCHFRPGFGSVSGIGSGIGSGSAFCQKPRSGSAYNECGSETLTRGLMFFDPVVLIKLVKIQNSFFFVFQLCVTPNISIKRTQLHFAPFLHQKLNFLCIKSTTSWV
jgi:hypothetical protein